MNNFNRIFLSSSVPSNTLISEVRIQMWSQVNKLSSVVIGNKILENSNYILIYSLLCNNKNGKFVNLNEFYQIYNMTSTVAMVTFPFTWDYVNEHQLLRFHSTLCLEDFYADGRLGFICSCWVKRAKIISFYKVTDLWLHFGEQVSFWTSKCMDVQKCVQQKLCNETGLIIRSRLFSAHALLVR